MLKDDAILCLVVIGETRQRIDFRGEQHFVGVLLVERAVQAKDLDSVFGWVRELDKAQQFVAVPHQHPILGVLIVGTRLRGRQEAQFTVQTARSVPTTPSCAVSRVDSILAANAC